jgi:hypothetical protein
VSGLGYDEIKRACRRSVKTVDQVLTVRRRGIRVEGTREVRSRDCQLQVHTDRAAKQEILRNQN